MKIVLASLILCSGLSFQASGQPPPSPPPPSKREGPPAPPPAPLIYSAPAIAEIKEFTPESKIFKAQFPGLPSEQKRTIGESQVTTYRVYRKGSNSVVAVTETTTRQSDRTEEFYRLIREGTREQGGKIENESEVSVSGWTGREFSLLQNYTFRRFRIFVVGTRIFEIQSDVTNWHIIGDKVKADWNKDTDRFFASFEIIRDKLS